MTERIIPITEGAAREAIRLGDEMAERMAAAELRSRRRGRAIERAISLLRSGRPDEALKVLESAQ
jgi:hypothetical protein